MSKVNKKEEPKQDKVMTKYDRKMQERKEKALKEKKQNAISKAITAVVAVVLVAAIVISIIVTVNTQKKAVSGTFMTVGDYKVTNVEYDYYYNVMLNNYLTNYQSFLPYMGYDLTIDPELQSYDENRTWGDFFAESAVEQLKETKAMLDDAKAAGFVYETEDEDYQTFIEGCQVQADAQGITLGDYYKQSFGDYATQARLEPYIKETLYVGAYANKLMEDYAPTDDEITARYEADKNNYDTITYRLYTFSADDTMTTEQAAAKASEMKEACVAGEDFQALCNKYDDEGIDDATDISAEALGENKNTIEGAKYTLINSLYADWLYDNARTADEVEVFADEANSRYYVVQFVEKIVDMETINLTISNEIASERVIEYKAGLVENYEVKDVAGELKYLTLPDAE